MDQNIGPAVWDPVPLVIFYVCFHHLYYCAIEPLSLTITLWSSRCSACLAYFKKPAQFFEDLTVIISTLVTMKVEWTSITTDYFIYQMASTCFSSLIWDGHNLHPFCECICGHLYPLPLLLKGSGPRTSIPSLSNGVPVLISPRLALGFGDGWLSAAQVSHNFTQTFTSFHILNQ